MRGFGGGQRDPRGGDLESHLSPGALRANALTAGGRAIYEGGKWLCCKIAGDSDEANRPAEQVLRGKAKREFPEE